MKQGKVLTAHNAEITTASISIKSLTIERKQVTLALFRQIQEEHIIDWKSVSLRGVGWGHVRYLIDEPPGKAINLLWQKGSELRRCIVMRDAPQIRKSCIIDIEDSKRIERITTDNGETIIMYDSYHPGYIKWNNIEWMIDEYEHIGSLVLDEKPSFLQVEKHNVWVKTSMIKINEYHKKCKKNYNKLKEEIITKRHKYEELTTALFDLPQLFIAV